MPKAVVIDLEVENHQWFQAVASPKCPDNYVVASGWGYTDERETHGRYFDSKPAVPDWAPYLNDPEVDTLVAHNAPFEIDWLMTDHRDAFLAFLRRGGRVFCTAYAHYLLSNQQDTYPSLNEIAPQYGGTPKVDAVKLLWEQGKLTSEIDKALLFDEYLLGPDGDIENTRKVYLAQLPLIAERGLSVSIWERMHGMLYNALCMHFGMKVDRDLAEQHIAEQNTKLAELAQVIDGAFQVPEHLQGEFKSSSQYHLSAALYGGSVAHRHRVQRFKDDGTPYFVKADFYRFGASEKASVRVAVPSEGGSSLEELEAQHGAVIRFKSGKNKGQPKVFREDTDEIDTKWEDTYTPLPGLLDLTKMPKDVHRSWCEDFEQARTMRCGTTVKSTSGDAFEALLKRQEYHEHHELLHALVSQAKIMKDQSTYYLVQEFNDDGEPKKTSGMLQFVQPDGMVHANLNCTSTVTTRLSSTRPNLQNLPRGDEDDTGYQSRVKELFVSRFGPEGRILGIDFSNLETYVLADLSKDPALCQALLDGTDMHCLRLAGSLGEPYEDVLRKCKDKTHPEHDRYSALRTAIKPKSFALKASASKTM